METEITLEELEKEFKDWTDFITIWGNKLLKFKKEFNGSVEKKKTLSDKQQLRINYVGAHIPCLDEKDVKEALKRIKEKVREQYAKGCRLIEDGESDIYALDDIEVIAIIDEEMGDKLIDT